MLKGKDVYIEKYGKEPPKCSVGKPNSKLECFLKIATHLSYKPNFVNYMFRDDMISDGIENCVQYIHNFDPEKSKESICLLYSDHTLCIF